MNTLPILTIFTLLPLLGGIIVIGLPSEQRRVARGIGMICSLITLAIAVWLCLQFDSSSTDLQFQEQWSWIPSLGVEYHLAVDGLGLMMVLLSAILVPMALLASWRIEERVPLYFALVLFLETGLIGTFTALNFFHWFIFWEISLIPAFFLIKLWGGPMRSAAATQFFVYTMVGSVAMLLGFLAIYLSTDKMDFTQVAELGRNGTLASAFSVKLGWPFLSEKWLARIIFAAVFLGFAVKVPLIPFHTWLPSAYSEATTGTTMLLTGAMSKMGVYGFLRILLPIFRHQIADYSRFMNGLLWLAVITIVYSAAAAFAQRDLKRLLAYSSINHLGYCLLGVFAVARLTSNESTSAIERTAALNGVILQMFNHGLTAATLFCFVGFIEQRAGGLRSLNDFGGLRKIAPVFCGLMGIALFSSLGLPGLNGFIGEFLIFKGTFALTSWAAAVALLGLLITAVFILTVLQRVFNGPLHERWARFPDLTLSERVVIFPAIALMFVLGIYPQLLIGLLNGTVKQLIQQIAYY